MTTYLLDSDILIDFFKKKEEAQTTITHLMKQGAIAASVLSIAELRTGWSEQEADFFLPKLYALVDMQSVTREIAEYAGSLRRRYRPKGIQLALVDTLIAATVILSEFVLVTGNVKDYPKEVSLYPLPQAQHA